MVKPKIIQFPLSRNAVMELSVGDAVRVSGKIVTGRDKIHQFLFNEKPGKEDIPFNLEGSLLYHCGPIVKKDKTGFEMIACGPTTSSRVEMYEWWVIERYGIRAVMGKGGMGRKTLDALKTSGAVYLQTIGGAAAVLADKVKRVIDVWKLEEFGIPEAMWLIEIEDFPAIVTMDAYGNSLHDIIQRESGKKYRELMGLDVRE